jgi:glycosyltransferase involved in cell wall biosynthesis
MRVAFNGWFWNHLDTGSGQYLRRLVAALIAADPALELHVFVPSGVEGSEVDAGPNLQLISRPTPRASIGKVRWEQLLVPRWAYQAGAELLHVPYWAPPMHASTPVIVTAHDIIPLILKPYRGGWHVRAYTALVSAGTSRAQLVLTDSEASRRDILEHLRIGPDRVRAIPLAVGEAYTPVPSDQDGQLRAALDVVPPYVLYVGGFDVRKNLTAVFDAFAVVQKRCPDATLVIAGSLPSSDTPFTPDPRRLASEAHLPESALRFVGYLSEVQKVALLRGARAFVYPSAYEGFGYPPLEALACGVPVVVSNTSSLPEVVGDAGILLEPDDISGMADALIQLLTDESFHANLARRAYLQSRRFSWQHTARATRDAYEAVNLASDRAKRASKGKDRHPNNKIEV